MFNVPFRFRLIPPTFNFFFALHLDCAFRSRGARLLKGEDTMAKYKPYTYAQDMLIPVSLQEQLMPSSLEYAINTLVEEWMDVSLFDEKYRNDETGRLHTIPEYC